MKVQPPIVRRRFFSRSLLAPGFPVDEQQAAIDDLVTADQTPATLPGRSASIDVMTEHRDPQPATDTADWLPSADHPEWPYEFLDVPVGDLVTGGPEQNYQRDVKPKLVQKIVKAFDPLALDPLVVNIRDDNQGYLVRGQHRRLALLELFGPDVRVRCRVYCGLTYQQEAHLYVIEDDLRKPQGTAEKWQAGLDAGDWPYVQVEAMATATGFRISPKGKVRGKGVIRSVAALMKCYTDIGPRPLYDTLRVLQMAGGEWATEPRDEIIRGLCRFVSRYRNQLRPASHLVDVLHRIGYWTLLDQVNLRRRTDKTAGYEAVVIELEKEYDKRKSGKNRLDRVDGSAPGRKPKRLGVGLFPEEQW